MKYKNPKLIYYYDFISCSIPRLFVYLQMRSSTSKQHSCVRGLLREYCSNQSGASGLPYHCTPLVCISAVIGLLAVWRHNKPKTKNQKPKDATCPCTTASSNLFCLVSQKERDKVQVVTSRGGAGASCVRLWLTRDIV